MKLILMLVLMASMAQAGQGGGNGGGSVVCRDEKNLIQRAELLDLFEGRVLYKRNYNRNLTPKEYFSRVEERLNDWPGFKARYLDVLAYIQDYMILVDDGHVLSRTDDVDVLVMEKGCQYEQLANYTDIGEIFVSDEIYSFLGDLGRTGLIVHEAIYYLFRQNESHKERVMDARRLTGQLMAEIINKTIIDAVMARHGLKKEEK